MPDLPQAFDRFDIIRILGKGGMGSVYLARDQRLGRQVALKVLNSEDLISEDRRSRFLREAKTAAAIQLFLIAVLTWTFSIRLRLGRRTSVEGYKVVLVELADVDRHRAVGIERVEHVPELRAPDDLVDFVRRARVHGLGERFVEAVEQDEQLGVELAQVVGRAGVERARFVDRMDDGPCERKEDHTLAFEFERDEFAIGRLSTSLAPVCPLYRPLSWPPFYVSAVAVFTFSTQYRLPGPSWSARKVNIG